MTDVVSEQRYVVVVADAFVIVLGLQMLPNFCISVSCIGLFLVGKGGVQ